MVMLVTENELLSAAINSEGRLTFTRENGDIIDAGIAVGPAVTDADMASIAADAGSSFAGQLSATTARVGEALLTSPRPFAPVNVSVVTTMQPGHGYVSYSSSAASLTDDPTDFLLGGQSLKVVTKSDNAPAMIQKTGQVLDLTGKYPRVLIKVDDLTELTELVLYIGTDTLSDYYQWTLAQLDPSGGQHLMKAGEWMWVTLGFADAAVVGAPNRAALTNVRLRARATNGNALTVHWGGIALVDESDIFPSGVVSFTYDDSYATHYTEARPALDKHGYVGTFYTICDRVDAGAGWITLSQLKAMSQSGHEVAAHAYTMEDHQTGFHAMADDVLAASLRNMRGWLTDHGFDGGDHLAYPQGAYTPATLEVVNKFHTSARTVNRLMMETLRPADARRLRSFSVSNSTAVATIKSRIDKAIADGGWLVLTFHDLVTAPSNPNHFSIADHAEIVDYCASKGVPVRTVGDVLARLNGPSASSSPVMTTAAAVNQALGNSDTRIQVVSRHLVTAGLSIPTGELHLSCFTPVVDMEIANLSARTSAAAWTGHTLARIGLFTTDPATGAITLVAATANDTTLFVAGNTTYRRALSTSGGLPATYTLAAGQRYAVGVLGVGQSAGNLLAATVNSALSARAPRLCGRITGLADLPSSGTLVETGTALWAEVG